MAFATDSVTLLVLAGSAAVLLLVGVVSWLAARILSVQGRTSRRLLALGVTVGTVLIVGVLAEVFVFTPMSFPYDPQEPTTGTRYWELSTGSRVAYSATPAEGIRKPTPVVLLHGGPGVPYALRPELLDRVLAGEGFDVYRYHQVGAGLSERLADPGDYTVGRQVADLEAIRRKVGAEKMILIGGSWGGTLAANYMAAHPERVEKAVFESPGAIWDPAFSGSGDSGGDELPETMPLRFYAVSALALVNPEAAQNLAPDREMDGALQAVVSRVLSGAGCSPERGQGAPQSSPPEGVGYYANVVTNLDERRTTDPRPALRDNRTPALVLRGECDYLGWQIAREYRDLLPEATMLYVEDAGHLIESDRPKLYTDAVRSFLIGEPLPQKPYDGASEPSR